MGQCIGRGSDDPFNDIHPHIFSVLNIDENGSRRIEGRIEVTETDLILNQRGHDRIRWPLRSLRRYGFEAGVFSFESGRRCPTGPGIYAFRCSRAQNLFNLMQSRVRNPYIDDRPGPFPDSPRPDPIPRENILTNPNRALLINPMPSLAPGSYINITPSQQNDIVENIEPLGQPNEPHEMVTIEDIQASFDNSTEPPSRANSNTITSNPLADEHEHPTSPILGIPPQPLNITSELLSGIHLDPENNNVPSDSDLNGLIQTISQNIEDYKYENQRTEFLTSSEFKQKPPALDLSPSHHVIHQRPNLDHQPTYENVDLSKCPPPLPNKPTTPISPPTPKHTEIEHKFFPDGPQLLEGTTPKEESPTETHQLSYAILDLNPPTSNVNHSPSSPMNFVAPLNRSSHFTYNSELSPAKHLSKSADSLVFGISSNPLIQNPHPIVQQEEQLGCEYTHIDIRRTEAYLKSKEQNENNGHLVFDGTASYIASSSIPEDRAISTNEIKEGNPNPLTKALTKALPTITIDKSIFDFNVKRNSVISN